MKFNIYYRKDGRWEGRLLKETRPNGKRSYKYIFGKTRAQVEKRMEDIMRESFCGSCRSTFSEVFTAWFAQARRRIKESTAANYAMKAEKHLLAAFGRRVISDITENDIYKFIETKKADGLSNRYIADILALMKSVFKYAARQYNMLDPTVGVSVPHRSFGDIRTLDAQEQETLRHYISLNRTRSSLGAALALSTGLRIGELCALQWKDIDLEKRILTVSKTIQRVKDKSGERKTKLIITEPKSFASNRSIPLTDSIIEFLSAMKGDSREYVLSGRLRPIEPRTMQYRFSNILKNANLPSVHFHSLRHVFASNCIKTGCDVKALAELLGHSRVEITMNLYIHSSFEQKRGYLECLKLEF